VRYKVVNLGTGILGQQPGPQETEAVRQARALLDRVRARRRDLAVAIGEDKAAQAVIEAEENLKKAEAEAARG
jgi:hypothetical protein